MYRFTVYAHHEDMARLAASEGVDCTCEDDETEHGEAATFMSIPSEEHAAQMMRVLNEAGYRVGVGRRRSIISDPTFARASQRMGMGAA